VTRVYVSVGSNQQPATYIPKAIEELEATFSPLLISPIYESVAVGFNGDNFINLVVGFDTRKTLIEVATEMDRIEQLCGRERGTEKFSSRTMDLDLLLFGELVRHDEQFDIPRNEIELYAFVLKPLADIAPDEMHPEIGQSFIELWQEGDLADQELWEVKM
jgi:2-amino-4-hydroxy-6-hydroxymethyldihydropteridine diphosphokinase